MSRFKKIMLSFLGIIAAAAVIFAGWAYLTLRSSLPDAGAQFTQDINGKTSVARDDRGVVYISAGSDKDLFFAQGYVHADERLWQMEFNRRVVEGRLAETLGPGFVEADRFLRTLGLHRVSRRVVEKTSPLGRTAMSAYARGVNARINEGRLPPEMRILGIRPRPWSEADVAGVLALMGYNLGQNWQEESLRRSLQDVLPAGLFSEIMPPYDDWDTPVIREKDRARNAALKKIEAFIPRFGSNSWVVSADNWNGDAPLLANDPHLPMGLPCIWFENSLKRNGETRVYGWSIPGAPGVVIGHNEKIAWGMTNTGDTQDLFVEKRNPDNPLKFKHDGEWYEAGVIKEEIAVKGQDAPEILEVIITGNGPLISKTPEISLAWTAYHLEKSTVDAILKINRAKNWRQFSSALKHFTLPVQNIVYADVYGNIGFKTAGMLPVRKKGKGLVPSPGWDSDYGWEGFIPHEELPSLFNPPRGYIATANHKVAGDDYPYTIAADNASPYRMMRIQEVLSSATDLDVSDMKALQTDWTNRHAAERLGAWLDILEQAEELTAQFNDSQTRGFEIIKSWSQDPVSAPGEPAPAIYASWYLHLMEAVFAEKMGDNLYNRFIGKGYMAYKALDYLLEKGDSAWFKGDLELLLAQSFASSINELSRALGPKPETWQWKDLQTVSFDHVLGENRWLATFFNRGPYPYGGDYETVGRAAYNLNDPFNVTFAAGLRFIAVMEPDIKAWGVLAGGQSGHFMSAHYDDQVKTWLDNKYYRLGGRKKYTGNSR